MTAKALAVFSKETRDAARDRRSLTSALTYSLFGPLVLGLALGTLARMNADDEPLRLAVAGPGNAPSLVRSLEANGVEVVPAPADVRAAVRAGDLDLALVIPEGYGKDFRASRPARIELVHDASRSESRGPVRRVQSIVERYGTQVASLRLSARGVSPQVAQPVRLAEVDLSTAASRAALALGTFPVFLLMAVFISGMNVAIDTTAGERERGSLEPLLVHAVPRTDLVLGKWMASSAFNLLGLGMTLLVSYLVLGADRFEGLDVPVALRVGDTLRMLAILFPVVLFAPALQMLISLFARSFKEAQTYLSLLLFVPVLPGFLLALQRVDAEPWMRSVPILAQQVLLGDLLRGEAIAPAAQMLAAGTTLAATAVCIAVTARMLRHERIVLGR
ncbi:MAG TPA: ABC transporter permease subunit [Thermoanaerobaculia bacterium]|nr:ABC transporter permease subunit [Thermoanaerobaculia bacterium]